MRINSLLLLFNFLIIFSCKNENKDSIPNLNPKIINNVSIQLNANEEKILEDLKNVEYVYNLKCYNQDSICDTNYEVFTALRYDFNEKNKKLIFISKTDDYLTCSSCKKNSSGNTILKIQEISLNEISRIDTSHTNYAGLSRPSFNEKKYNISLFIYPKYNSESINDRTVSVYYDYENRKNNLKYSENLTMTSQPIIFTLPEEYALFIKNQIDLLLSEN